MARKSGSSGEKTAKMLRLAALDLFASHGYAAVSMRQIAREIGVQAGALYLYTPDKQSLLLEIMKTHMEELLAAWEKTPLQEASTASEKLEQFVRFHLRFHLSRADEVFVSYMELRNLTPENFAIIEGLRKRYEKILEDILREGVDSGEFRPIDARVTTFALIAMLTGLTTWFRDDGRLSVDDVEDVYLQLVLSSVGCAN